MILTTAAFLSILGLIAWVLGHIYSYQGIAALGAVLMVGVGGAVMVGGLDTAAGEQRVQIDANTTEVTTTYEPIGTTSSFPTGLVLTLLGGVMTMRALEGGQIQ